MDVLLVEDEPRTCKTYTKLLERAGFRVNAVENGLAAIAELNEHSFRAIVLDVGLPFLEGRKLYNELVDSYPAMADRVIFVTGNLGDEEVHRFLEETGRPFLGTPASATELIEVVRRTADRKD